MSKTNWWSLWSRNWAKFSWMSMILSRTTRRIDKPNDRRIDERRSIRWAQRNCVDYITDPRHERMMNEEIVTNSFTDGKFWVRASGREIRTTRKIWTVGIPRDWTRRSLWSKKTEEVGRLIFICSRSMRWNSRIGSRLSGIPLFVQREICRHYCRATSHRVSTDSCALVSIYHRPIPRSL
jgi:hypothetical protein